MIYALYLWRGLPLFYIIYMGKSNFVHDSFDKFSVYKVMSEKVFLLIFDFT